MNNFEALGIDEKIVKAITDLGFETPSPIQEKAIPALLNETTDLVGLAQTGTGKTAAFGIPLIQKVDFNSKKTQALILCPTRELCVQITKDLTNYSKYFQGTNIVPVYGGASIETQIKLIQRGAQIIVATPGRMADMIRRKKADLSEVRWVVLDEADEMLDMGFKDELDIILDTTPKEKNTWLFSATMPAEVARIAKTFMNNPFEVSVGAKNSSAVNISHEYYPVHARDRYLALKRLVDCNPDIFGMIFCRTKIETQEIAEKLMKDGYNADSLHGDLSQMQRDRVMERFRSKALQILVATDVAARGIDVNNITHVIHFSLPDDIENYTHRSGRTARAGKTGVSMAIVNMREVGKIRDLERILKTKFTQKLIPNGFEVCEKQLFSLIKRVHDVQVSEQEIEPYIDNVYKELDDLSKEELIKKFVSIEFNRFLSYYKNAPDINVNTSKEARRSENGRNFDDTKTRFFINVGELDDINKSQLLRMICDASGVRGNDIGRIDVKNSFSFFDVESTSEDVILSSLNEQTFNGRKIKVEISAKKDDSSSSGKSFGRTGGRREFGGSGNRENNRSSFEKPKYESKNNFDSKPRTGSRPRTDKPRRSY